VVEWDEGNLSELGAHAIADRDVEDVYAGGPVWVPNRKLRSGDWKMVGRTRTGRAITVIVAWNEIRRSLRPITGWDCTPGERTRYLS
jgi:hypothetical protein